jgi:hypothetical protein
VPPEVVTGGLVVVVGDWPAFGEGLEGAVRNGVVGGWVPGVLAPEVVPGCSLAMTTPTRTVAPVAARMAERVRRRTRASACSRDSGELSSWERLDTPQAYGAGLTSA